MLVDPSGFKPTLLQWGASGIAVLAGVVLIGTGIYSIIGASLIASGVGSIAGGYANEAKGGSFDAGYYGGGFCGALTGLGIGAGGMALIAATSTSNLAALGLVGKGITYAFAGGSVGGAGGDIITQGFDLGWSSINHSNSIQAGLINGSLSSLAVFFSPSAALSDSGYHVFSAVASIISEFVYDAVSFGLDRLRSMKFSLPFNTSELAW